MYPHGDNLTQKEGLKTKYADKECRFRDAAKSAKASND
jgi:hypothetical protein